jgi:hypothetical protein
LSICPENGNSGSYVLYRRADQWGENTKTSNPKTIQSGSFLLVEDYDMYGDRALVSKDQADNKKAFLINTFGMIKICTIEDDMFAKAMERIDRDCSINPVIK